MSSDSQLAPPENSTARLFDLPFEVRRQILRHLLFHPPYIPSKNPQDPPLALDILFVNRQLNQEGSDILYGENVWEVDILTEREIPSGSPNWCHQQIRSAFRESPWDVYQTLDAYYFARQPKIRRYHIRVSMYVGDQADDEDDREAYNEKYLWGGTVQNCICSVARVLAEVPSLQYLHIQLGRHVPKYRVLDSQCSVLQGFALLRNVQRVEVSGAVTPEYAQYLKMLLQGDTPVDHLPKMHEALVWLARLARRPECQGTDHGSLCDHSYLFEMELANAWAAVVAGDVETFKRIRSELVPRITAHIQDVLNRLGDHDGVKSYEPRWVVEQRHENPDSGAS